MRSAYYYTNYYTIYCTTTYPMTTLIPPGGSARLLAKPERCVPGEYGVSTWRVPGEQLGFSRGARVGECAGWLADERVTRLQRAGQGRGSGQARIRLASQQQNDATQQPSGAESILSGVRI